MKILYFEHNEISSYFTQVAPNKKAETFPGKLLCVVTAETISEADEFFVQLFKKHPAKMQNVACHVDYIGESYESFVKSAS